MIYSAKLMSFYLGLEHLSKWRMELSYILKRRERTMSKRWIVLDRYFLKGKLFNKIWRNPIAIILILVKEMMLKDNIDLDSFMRLIEYINFEWIFELFQIVFLGDFFLERIHKWNYREKLKYWWVNEEGSGTVQESC